LPIVFIFIELFPHFNILIKAILIYYPRQTNYNFNQNKSPLKTMDLQINSVIEVLLSSDNERRIQAEKFIEQIPLTTFDQGIDAFVFSMTNENPQVPKPYKIDFNNGRTVDEKEIFG
jgi:hypothetical protein